MTSGKNPMNESAPVVEEANVALLSALSRPRSVLDVGCGMGLSGAPPGSGRRHRRTAGYPTGAAPARRSHQVDPSDFEGVSKSRGRQFDLISSQTSTEYRRSGGDAAALPRAPRTEGRLIISLRNRTAWNVLLKITNAELGYRHGEPGRLFSHAEAAALVESIGLEVLRVEHNPMLARAIRPLVVEGGWVLPPPAQETASAYRDLPVYHAYRTFVRPWEDRLAQVAPELLSYQHVVVARKPIGPRPLSLTVGMLTMDEEESIERMMKEIRRVAPDAQILCVDSSMKDQTPFIAERMGARVVRQLPPRGHGPAMEVLMYEASKQSDALIYLDCDFTYPPDVIPGIRKILESGVDVVNAARTRTRPEAMPLPNYLANKSFALLAQATAGAKVADLHSGMRGYRSSVIRAFSFDGEGDAIPSTRCSGRPVWVPGRRGADRLPGEGRFFKLRKLAAHLDPPFASPRHSRSEDGRQPLRSLGQARRMSAFG
jgi:hypothetical protein